MWKMKSCPKCNGDLYLDYDEDGMFNHCLQCGYVGDLYPSCPVAEQSDAIKQLVMSSR
ncbi:MAG: hypothetical protein PHT28_04415 [Dehalococcoidales bacterium]|jgi:DNA-directed RNA polymerase subunit M/transcription elongation factor TFIIS|nr:hypothetical protein [Dehalococcoidales bacterium]MDD4230916.1 hypothetical protein [Dehalococcoidales bacterium]MDD4465998.1 hypothetical protein [Dehalococcoidales bacterium]